LDEKKNPSYGSAEPSVEPSLAASTQTNPEASAASAICRGGHEAHPDELIIANGVNQLSFP
jgi:hypothetical protein